MLYEVITEHPDGAILQRDKKTYAIVPRTPAGLITPAQLSALARVVEKHKIPIIKITSGQRIVGASQPERGVVIQPVLQVSSHRRTGG